MSRPANPIPKYERYKGDRARVRYRGREYHLGKYQSPESLAEYRRLCAGWATAPVPPKRVGGALVSEVVNAFFAHAERHYRGPDGRLTSEYREHERSTVHLLELYGHTPAREFGPLALQAVRQKMVDAGWCRSVVNKRVVRCRGVFRWAVSRELVPVELVTALECVPGLEKGRTDAPEAEPVEPAPMADVRAALPFLDRHQRAMAELQVLTGMRPGEVCGLKICEVDRSGPVWVFRPGAHKTTWRDGARAVFVGPEGQRVIRAFLSVAPVDAEECLFSPYRAREERFAAARLARKSKVPPSQQNRTRMANPNRRPADRFSVNSYGHALARACEQAGVPAFSPNQLRHTFASAVRAKYGIEAAQVLLGHASLKTSEIYAAKSLELALRVAAEVG